MQHNFLKRKTSKDSGEPWEIQSSNFLSNIIKAVFSKLDEHSLYTAFKKTWHESRKFQTSSQNMYSMDAIVLKLRI